MAFIPLHDTNPWRHIRRPWVAWGIIAANVLIYFSGVVVGDQAAVASVSFGLIPAIFNGVIERPADFIEVPNALTLVTYGFFHADFIHLAGNMIFLWVFADNVEDALGHVRYFIFYILCDVAAGYAFVLSDPTSSMPVIGASGAVGGNIAAYLLLHPRAKVWILLFVRIPLRLSAMWILGFWVVFQFFAAFTGNGDDGVAWWAHIGGLVAGAVLVIFMRRRGVPLFDRSPETLAVVSGPHQATAGRTNADRTRGPWET